jgi:hypothetical protein
VLSECALTGWAIIRVPFAPDDGGSAASLFRSCHDVWACGRMGVLLGASSRRICHAHEQDAVAGTDTAVVRLSLTPGEGGSVAPFSRSCHDDCACGRMGGAGAPNDLGTPPRSCTPVPILGSTVSSGPFGMWSVPTAVETEILWSPEPRRSGRCEGVPNRDSSPRRQDKPSWRRVGSCVIVVLSWTGGSASGSDSGSDSCDISATGSLPPRALDNRGGIPGFWGGDRPRRGPVRALRSPHGIPELPFQLHEHLLPDPSDPAPGLAQPPPPRDPTGGLAVVPPPPVRPSSLPFYARDGVGGPIPPPVPELERPVVWPDAPPAPRCR